VGIFLPLRCDMRGADVRYRVLDHVLTHPDPYVARSRLPLRTIYTLNYQTASASPADFKTTLMEYLQNMPEQPCTLPPVFLTTFIKDCFPQNFEDVDFDKALTALDYLCDLELRRKRELEKATKARGEHDAKIRNFKSRSAKLDRTYAVALTGLRRFVSRPAGTISRASRTDPRAQTLVNELALPRFNKCNCVAFLNTLYPIEEEDINAVLTANTLAVQRQALWKYIIAVERNGPGILDTVRNQTEWKRISDNVHDYCERSLAMIQTAEDLARPASLGSFQSDISVEMEPISPKNSFGRRDSGNESSESEFEASGKRSTLEKIVRGLAKLGVSSHHKKVYQSDWNASSKNVYTTGWNQSLKKLPSADRVASNDEVRHYN